VPRKAPVVIILALLAIAVAAAAIGSVVNGEEPVVPVPPQEIPAPPGQAGEDAEPIADPFAYDPGSRKEFESRAAAGNAHGLYAFSPGGAIATAERVAGWRRQVDAAADAADIDPELVEALVFLESAGREDAMAGDVEGAVGLTQILAETGSNLLGMRVDSELSKRYARRIRRALRRGDLPEVQRLRAARAQVDERFDPAKALAGTARYLVMAKERFDGSDQLALVSYHMGMGNLEGVLAAYGGGARVPYAQVYFDSSPLRHPGAHARLTSLGDDSANYLWKLLAARDIMRLYRTDLDQLRELERLHGNKNSAEEVLHPEPETPTFATTEALRAAWDAGDIRAFPDDPARTGLRLDRRMGELAPAADVRLYRGLRPEALALALYVGAQVRALAREPQTALTVTSTVRTREYQQRLVRRNREATRNFSLHTTGWTFDIARRYGSRRQAQAFQFVLDRLRSLNLIAWVREPGAIHVTASRDAAALEPLLERIAGNP